ncbi:hypothetical protein OG320_05100 [Microbispora sp. NBC_01189]|uniref:hypothetical protein n=1 Tax=Microbispora sp. NBC_01189 TaxID=2903583 RepID=UPI002E108992|nr:hypothetical protein OG320_05100 [Microbispora sp. NBC_01189]
MSGHARRRADRLDELEERLEQIRGAIDVIDDEQLIHAIVHSEKGRQLVRVLANLRVLADGATSPRRGR